MTVNVTPLHDRVLIRRLEEKETAKGGIIIPDTAKEKPHEGHADIRTTMNVCGKAMDESKRAARGKVVRLVLPSKVA